MPAWGTTFKGLPAQKVADSFGSSFFTADDLRSKLGRRLFEAYPAGTLVKMAKEDFRTRIRGKLQ
jgi:hypothetical protein